MQFCNVNNVDYTVCSLSSIFFVFLLYAFDCEIYDTESLFLKLVDKVYQAVVMFSLLYLFNINCPHKIIALWLPFWRFHKQCFLHFLRKAKC